MARSRDWGLSGGFDVALKEDDARWLQHAQPRSLHDSEFGAVEPEDEELAHLFAKFHAVASPRNSDCSCSSRFSACKGVSEFSSVA